MLISDMHAIGNNLFRIRKAKGLTQSEVAELSELSDRTYADIERGSVSMRVDTLIKICSALQITPNDIMVDNDPPPLTPQDITDMINHCSVKEKETAMQLLQIYLRSLGQ